MTLLPVFVFWAIALAGLRGSPIVLLYALFAGMPFASLAVVPTELTGGLSLTPAPVVSLLLILKCVSRPAERRWFANACVSTEQFALLFVFWVVAVLTTLFAPLIFAGEVEIVPLRGEVGQTAMLEPTVQQFSQLGYVSVSVFAVVAAGRLFQRGGARRHVLRAVALGAGVLCVTGYLDWLAGHVDIAHLLEPLRTASYAIATDVALGTLEMKRVSGVTPEPAAFGSLCVMFLATLWFHRRVMRERWLRFGVAPALCAALATMIWLSTSTTAYVGLAIVILAAVAESTWRLIRSRRRTRERRHAMSETRRFVLVTVIIVGLFAVFPEVYARAAEVIDKVVLTKTESRSFDERSMWTAVSLQSAVATNGVGVGLGGTRASNSFVALLSNVGVLGTLLYVGFVAATYLRQPSKSLPDGGDWLTAYRWSVPAIFALGLMAGTTADFGPYLALMFGSTVALQEGRRTERLLERTARTARRASVPKRRGRRRRRMGGFALPNLRVSPGSTRGRLAGFMARSAPFLDLGGPDRDPVADPMPAPSNRAVGRGFECTEAPFVEL